MFTVQKSEAEILWFKNSIGSNGWFASDSQGRTRTSDGDPRTGMFHQTRVTVGDTACSVKGVLQEPVRRI